MVKISKAIISSQPELCTNQRRTEASLTKSCKGAERVSHAVAGALGGRSRVAQWMPTLCDVGCERGDGNRDSRLFLFLPLANCFIASKNQGLRFI
jgi:hypothetical protein